MKVGVLRWANYLGVAEKRNWEELVIHLHQLNLTSMTPRLAHTRPAVDQVVGSWPSTCLLANDLNAKVMQRYR